jgi:peptidoglycan/LPS O-acetylase OafA/YrhL
MTAAIETSGTPPPATSRGVTLPAHLPALDGLRGLAILMVVVHMLSLLEAPSDIVGRVISTAFGYGWMGVQLFFALSGFLITGILLDARGAPGHLTAFYARRFLRIFPLYYGTLFVAFVLAPALGAMPPALEHDRAHQIWLWTYLANWTAPTEAGSHAFPHFWSLSVEEQFYLVWPFALLRADPRGGLRLCLGVALVALAARVALLFAGVTTGALYTFTISRMDALALGGAAAAALRVPGLGARLAVRPGRLWGATLVTFAAGAVAGRYKVATLATSSVGYSFLSAACALAVLAAATSDLRPRPGSPLRWTALRALGKYSYAVYVFHKPLHEFVGKPALARLGLEASRSTVVALAYICVGLLASFAAAFTSYHLYEKHFLRLKTRFVPRLAPALPLE